MVDRLYCLSNPAEPGLVRVAWCRDSDEKSICQPGERIDWTLKVRHAGTAVAALHRRMKLYRKNRGNGVYRCCPGHAKAAVIRYAALPRKSWSASSSALTGILSALMPARRSLR